MIITEDVKEIAQGSENQSEFQSKKNESLRKLAKIAQEVGLPDWASSPQNVDDLRQEYLPQARKQVLAIAANPEMRSASFEILKRLFELDPMTEKTAVDLELILEKLAKYVDKPRGFRTSEIKKLLSAYASGVECFLSHFGFGHILGISKKVKAVFFKAPNLLFKLNKGNDLELDLEIMYALEGVKRLRAVEAFSSFFPTAKNLVKFTGSLVGFDSSGAEDAAVDLLSQAERETISWNKERWYELVYISRHLGRKALWAKVPVEQIGILSQFVLEQSKKRHGLFRSRCPWQVFVSAAQMYEHILTHHHVDDLSIYELALTTDLTRPGLLALLALHKKSNKPKKAFKGISQVIGRLIKDLSGKNPKKFILLQKAWKKEIATLDIELRERIEDLLEKQAKLQKPHALSAKEKLEQIKIAADEKKPD